MKTTSAEHGQNMSMNNLLSYCGLVDARITASEKDLPVQAQVAIQLQPAAEQGLQVEAAHLNQLLSVTLPPLPQF